MDLSRAVYSRDLKIVLPNNPIDLQLLKLIDFHLLRWSAQQRLFCVVGALWCAIIPSRRQPLNCREVGMCDPERLCRCQPVAHRASFICSRAFAKCWSIFLDCSS